jgi:hypothetical protein
VVCRRGKQVVLQSGEEARYIEEAELEGIPCWGSVCHDGCGGKHKSRCTVVVVRGSGDPARRTSGLNSSLSIHTTFDRKDL